MPFVAIATVDSYASVVAVADTCSPGLPGVTRLLRITSWTWGSAPSPLRYRSRSSVWSPPPRTGDLDPHLLLAVADGHRRPPAHSGAPCLAVATLLALATVPRREQPPGGCGFPPSTHAGSPPWRRVGHSVTNPVTTLSSAICSRDGFWPPRFPVPRYWGGRLRSVHKRPFVGRRSVHGTVRNAPCRSWAPPTAPCRRRGAGSLGRRRRNRCLHDGSVARRPGSCCCLGQNKATRGD